MRDSAATGVDRIISRISEDADREVDQIRTEAQQEADRILNDGRMAADAEYQRIIEHGEREIREITSQISSQARIVARNNVRTEKEKGIRRCFAEAEKTLQYLTQTKEYERVLHNFIREGIQEIGTRDVSIISTERDRPIEKILTRFKGPEINPCVSHECAITSGGVIIRSSSGILSIDNTFEARTERMKKHLIFDISKILYGEWEQ
jgi:vacuolar-type H+-ATPase subunit E/Vma4